MVDSPSGAVDSTRSAPTRTVQPLALAFLIPYPELGGSDGIKNEVVTASERAVPVKSSGSRSGAMPVSEDS